MESSLAEMERLKEVNEDQWEEAAVLVVEII